MLRPRAARYSRSSVMYCAIRFDVFGKAGVGQVGGASTIVASSTRSVSARTIGRFSSQRRK
ncbi:hypothetical protein [Cryobacterium sp. Hz9]|uniref:hypothetical protein n=1 Tax=Cryobacterium sp. Hz9 TaxID=1259167 RepID=UPI001069C1D7|nr:hypothetical protein [Cryobacterium sp. Hz9]TFB68448.1 hypothetical protein E3N85_05230 [Cryobacterium sp. Hz9]